VMFEDKQLCMPRSIERLEDRILTKGITIDSSPVTYSCAANAALDTDGQNNRAFDKKRSRGRIDGLVTIAMATGAADAELEARKPEFQMLILG
jgi:phage terminase large subunit-like protein